MGKNQATFRRPSANEQLVLDRFELRLLTEPAEFERGNALLVEHHYLHSATLVGEHLRYVATDEGEWLAVVCFSAGSYHLRSRDEFIGWSPEQRRRRLPLVVNNSRLLILPEAHVPNLASCLLKQILARLSDDWLARWGHPVALVETFVDPTCFRGTTYQVSGWSELGPTSGFGRCAQDFYASHERPKQLWVRELVTGACRHLRAEPLPAPWAMVEARASLRRPPPVRCTTSVRDISNLLDECRRRPVVAEFRRDQALAYPVASLLAVLVLARLHEVPLAQRELAAFAGTLSQPQLRALRFRYDLRTGRVRCPGATVFYRVLGGLAESQIDAVLWRWQQQNLGAGPDSRGAIDGHPRHAAHGRKLTFSPPPQAVPA